MAVKVIIGNHSDVGNVRENNEDYFGYYKGSYGEIAIVCDGMGGHKGGKTASRITVEVIKQHFEKLGRNYNERDELKNSLIKANNAIINAASDGNEFKGMGSTAVVLLIRENKAFYAHLGDSRLYLIRNKEITQLTKDHSLVQELVDGEIITEQQALEHPQKNVITRALGDHNKAIPEVVKEPLNIYKNDVFVLCTDGLTNYIKDDEILKSVLNNAPQAAANLLIDSTKRKEAKDNITVQIVKIEKGKNPPLKLLLRNLGSKYKVFGIILISLLLLSLLFFFVYPVIEEYLSDKEPVVKEITKIESIPFSNLSISFSSESYIVKKSFIKQGIRIKPGMPLFFVSSLNDTTQSDTVFAGHEHIGVIQEIFIKENDTLKELSEVLMLELTIGAGTIHEKSSSLINKVIDSGKNIIGNTFVFDNFQFVQKNEAFVVQFNEEFKEEEGDPLYLIEFYINEKDTINVKDSLFKFLHGDVEHILLSREKMHIHKILKQVGDIVSRNDTIFKLIIEEN